MWKDLLVHVTGKDSEYKLYAIAIYIMLWVMFVPGSILIKSRILGEKEEVKGGQRKTNPMEKELCCKAGGSHASLIHLVILPPGKLNLDMNINNTYSNT